MLASGRHNRLLTAALILLLALIASAAVVLLHTTSATGDGVGQLESELGANSAQQSTIESAVHGLDGQIAKLDSQVALVQRRAASVRAAVAADQSQLAADQRALATQQRRITVLKTRLARADKALAAELVNRYEQPQQTIVSVVIDAQGFQQMLDQLQYIRSADAAEQQLISATSAAKAQATAAQRRLIENEQHERQATAAQLTESRSLDGMQSLLDSRRTALADAEAARTAALAATRAKGSALQSKIADARRQERAAQQAAEQPQPSGSTSTGNAEGATGAPDAGVDIYDGWAIPEPIVMCESGGQNDPPNSAGASGYYQIIPSTWTGEGGTGPAAYLASRAEQDQIASKLWNGGKGASDWVCAGIVGIS